MSDSTEVNVTLLFSSFVFYQLSSQTQKNNQWYKTHKAAWMPPAIAYPIVWSALFSGLVVTAYYMFLVVLQPSSWQFITAFVMFFIHMIANKVWSLFFWDYGSSSAALFILLLLMLPTVAVLFATLTIGITHNLWPVPVSILAAYTVWLIYASVINMYWVIYGLPTRTQTYK